jgi:APA family basic amino acid/polyamine antiporter
MAINSLVVIIGVFILRQKETTIEKDSFKIPFYPLPPIIFIGITLVTLCYLTIQNTKEILFSIVIIITGFLMYLLTRKLSKNIDKKNKNH